MKRLLFILSGLLFAQCVQAAEAIDLSVLPQDVERVDIYLLLGQSNMKGRGDIPAEQTTDPLIVNMNMENDLWYEAEHPLHKAGVPDLIDGSDNAGVGPGLDFAKTLLSQTNGVRIALVPCAVGGSWINLWQPGRDFYTNAIYRAQKALADAPPGVARIKGVLWLQGESDSTDARYAAYSGKLSTLVQSLRADLNEPDLPFIACTIGTFINSPNYPRVQEINYDLLSLPQREPYTACVDARDLSGHIGDNMHYNTASQEIIGARFAAEYAALTESPTNESGVVFSTGFEAGDGAVDNGDTISMGGTVAAGVSVSVLSNSGLGDMMNLKDENTSTDQFVAYQPGDLYVADPVTYLNNSLALARANDNYFEFTLSSVAPLDLASFSFSYIQHGFNGATRPGTSGVALYSSLDGYSASLASFEHDGAALQQDGIRADLTGNSDFNAVTNVTFRFYQWCDFGGINANRYSGIDNLEITTGSSAAASNAPVQLAPLVSDGSVLQRDQAVTIRGGCTPDEMVKVEVNGQSQVATADLSGMWQVELAPEPAGGPYALTVSGTQSSSITRTNVYFGDVWLLCGQSNMEQSIGTQWSNFPEYYSEMPNTSDDFDDVRFVIIKQLQFTEGPADDVVLDVPWNRWEASALEDMSAAGYFFTREVNAVLCAVWQSLNGNGPEGRSTVRLKGM